MSNFSTLFTKLRDTVHQDEDKESSNTSKKRHTEPVVALKNEEKELRISSKRPREFQEPETQTTKDENDAIISKSKIRPFIPPKDYKDMSIPLSFLCIGAQKAGTTWLHEILRTHPNICLPRNCKEVHFWDWYRGKGLGWYSRQFIQSSCTTTRTHDSLHAIFHPATVYGEITPCYAILPEATIQEIQYLFPNLKIIFIARNLVDRAWSAILMELRHASRGIQPGEFPSSTQTTTPVYNAMEDPTQYKIEYFMQRLCHSTHTSRSNYSQALRTWLKYFPSQQIIILHYSDISNHPHQFMEQVCKHIGIEYIQNKTFQDKDLYRKVNQGTGPTLNYPIPAQVQKQFEEYLQPYQDDFNLLLRELHYSWQL